MSKIKWFMCVVIVCLLVSGCTINPNEKLTDLERRVEAVESRLDSCETRIDSCEGNVYTLSQRQTAIEESYSKVSVQKIEASVGTSNSLSAQDIQTALKNAGYYTGAIDGKIGPNTEKAIREFQQANSLKVDGIVGAETRSLLIKYLSQPTQATQVAD